MPNSQFSSAPLRTGRELSERVEHDFHQRPDPFRRWINWLSLAACLAVVAWLAGAAAMDRRTIYEAGPVAPVHRFFENDCEACHTTWAPASRLKFVVGDMERVHSVDDASCQRCHVGSPHYEGQDPPHAGLGCAACHREHRGDATLVATAEAQCVACHRALDESVASAKTSGGAPISDLPSIAITSFAHDHPDFDAVSQPDAAQLQFNHRVHLQHEYDKDGKLVKGILNERGELEDLSKNCAMCHQPDAEKRYMLPIRYAQHCQRCHPLYFDNRNFPGEVVPHGVATAALRGFLTERYAALTLHGELKSPLTEPQRPLPGSSVEPPKMSPEENQQVNEAVAEADRRLTAPVAASQQTARDAARQREQTLVGPEALGGCRLCHVVNQPEAAPDRRGFQAEWQVAGVNMRERWMARSRFSHDSHRFVACTACHVDTRVDPPRQVFESEATSDVLMPSIGACRSCHSDQSHVMLAEGVSVSSRGVASRCMDCHAYHRRENEPMSGSVFFDLPGRRASGNDVP